MVLPAMYGYWSAVTFTPRAVAASARSITWRSLGQLFFPAILKWEMWMCAPERAPTSNISSIASSSRSLSDRMCTTMGDRFTAATSPSATSSRASQ